MPTYNLTPANKVVTFGGSYPGALSAWARLRLPHIVHAALSTSSPIQAQLSFTGYNDVVAASLAAPIVGGTATCTANVNAAFRALDAALNGTVAQRAAVAKQMSSCSALNGEFDPMWGASNIASIIQGIVQYNNEEPGLNIAQVCQIFDNAGEPLDNLATLVGLYLQQTQGGGCLDNSYDDFIAQISNVTADPGAGGVGIRQWTLQTCAQFGYYQTCLPGTDCPLSYYMTLESNTQICEQVFGISAAVNADRVDFTNDVLGGANLTATNIIFANGQIDPWHALSKTASGPGEPLVFIPGGAHCSNMMPSSPADPAPLKAARQQIAALLAQMLAQ
jgi:serine protease 16